MGVLYQYEENVGGVANALVEKIGTAPLDTEAQDLSGAINELVAGGGGSNSWRSIKVNGTEELSSNTNSGPVDFINGNNTTVTFDSTGNTISINSNNSTYGDFIGASTAVAGANGLVPAPRIADADRFLKGDGTWEEVGKPMIVLSYGDSTWSEFLNAFYSNSIVYCKASSNSNPGEGKQDRMAFMAFLNINNASVLTSVEFQYYRSMQAHDIDDQGDQMYIYKLDKDNNWTVTVRNNYTKIVAGTNMSSSYEDGVLTLNSTGGGGGGSTVAITPSLSSGVKVADYSIDGSTGSIFAPSNTDVNVTQTESTDNNNYEVLLSNNASTATETSGVKKSSGLKYNPSTGKILTTGTLEVGSAPSANMDVATKKYVDDSVGAAIAQVLNTSY